MSVDTDALIARLSADLRPVSPLAVPRTLALFALPGLGLSFLLMLAWLGLRPDLAQALAGTMFWEKAAYTVCGGVAGALMLERLARPDGKAPGLSLQILVIAVALLALHAVFRLATALPSERTHLLMGASASVCARNIAVISAPILVGLVLATRRLAPTRPGLAGAACGLMAGGFGAAIYSLHCPEAAAPFVAVFYSLGVLTSTALGALVGKVSLRWR